MSLLLAGKDTCDAVKHENGADVRGGDNFTVKTVSDKSKRQTPKATHLLYCTISDSPESYLRRRTICPEPEIALIIPW